MATLESRIQQAKEDAHNAERFVGLIAKYTDLQELNSKILHELIQRINVHEKQVDDDGNVTKAVEIVYNFVGYMELEI